MEFRRIQPEPSLTSVVECFWTAEDSASDPHVQKIVPDGFTEIIFHFGDPYLIKLKDQWEQQPLSLLAGQLNKYFFLQNSGVSSILGIKLKPTAVTALFDLNMKKLTDQVVDLRKWIPSNKVVADEQFRGITMADRIDVVSTWLKKVCDKKQIEDPVHGVVAKILDRRGMATVTEMVQWARISERQLQNQFNYFVGLSPKRYARILRFNYIFELIQERGRMWTDVAYEAAYYDQSHFIRNFRDFTGENPAAYAFDEKNFANFFMNRR